jgi:hypothetical protein
MQQQTQDTQGAIREELSTLKINALQIQQDIHVVTDAAEHLERLLEVKQ